MSKLNDAWAKLPPLFDDEFVEMVSSANPPNNSTDRIKRLTAQLNKGEK